MGMGDFLVITKPYETVDTAFSIFLLGLGSRSSFVFLKFSKKDNSAIITFFSDFEIIH